MMEDGAEPYSLMFSSRVQRSWTDWDDSCCLGTSLLLGNDGYILNGLVDMYAECGEIDSFRRCCMLFC